MIMIQSIAINNMSNISHSFITLTLQTAVYNLQVASKEKFAGKVKAL
jgi:hypothetical protein